jgi:hypothetical protein
MKLHFISMLLALCSGNVLATSFYPETFENFTAKARTIVRGTIKQQRVEKSVAADGSITIHTYALVEVKESIKGRIERPEIRIRKVGGEMEGYHQEVPGSPEFKENEESVFFLTSEQEDGSFEIESLELGKFGLKRENGNEVLTGGMLAFQQKSGMPPAKPPTLSDLRKLVGNAPVQQAPPPGSPGASAAPPAGTPAPTGSSEARPSIPTPSPTAATGEEPGLRRGVFFGILSTLLIAGWLLRRRRKS